MRRRRKRRRRERITTFIKGKYWGVGGKRSTRLLPYKHPSPRLPACLPAPTHPSPPPAPSPNFLPCRQPWKGAPDATLLSPCLTSVPTLPQPGESRAQEAQPEPGRRGRPAQPAPTRAGLRAAHAGLGAAHATRRRQPHAGGRPVRAGQPARRLPPPPPLAPPSVSPRSS